MATAGVPLSRLGPVLLALMMASGAGAQAADAPAPAAGDLAPPPGLDLYMPVPGGELPPGTVALGRRLFFDAALSRDSSVACSSCHRPELAFTDGRAVPRGIDGHAGRRNVPTLANRGWGRAFSWDGRAATLEAQAVRPIQSPIEMDLLVEDAARRLSADSGYARAFRAAFGRGPSGDAVAAALAAYLRTIRAGDSPFDRFTRGETGALSPLERLGLDLFQGRARCDRCHTGPLLTDEAFHNTGIAWRDVAPDPTGWGAGPEDVGRAAITGRPADRGAFKTPTLRQVAATAPYMHDGSLASLEDVVEFYDRGGIPNPLLDPVIRPLGLATHEKRALVAFLRALSGTVIEGR